MTHFADFLRTRLDAGGFSTEDSLASFLPLARQVVDTHAAGHVAPLDGIADLHVDGVRIWFEQARQRIPVRNLRQIEALEQPDSQAVDIVHEALRTTDAGDPNQRTVNLRIGVAGQPVERPVYLPGYTSWEQPLGHHDPLTDIFHLGMILASLACGLDFHDPADLERFVACRRNLFELSRNLHPVVAQAIVRMTELNRHRRAQDLRALVESLENYRDVAVDVGFDLARLEGFSKRDPQGKQQLVLARLQERLFEISRRNRLLHFQPTLSTVNLTQASVPLTFDIKHIRPDQILTWNQGFSDELLSGQPISLSKYLNFAEALYLPSVLDQIRIEAQRDTAEFGFAQLRLVACFLRWTNLKATPPESFDSPLVLLPVELTRKKGVRDTFLLKAVTAEAEINPVLRHQFKQLYGIDLPDTIDLATTRLDTFHELLSTQIAASEPAVVLNKIERPQIDLIHEKARRRLDQYERRARLSGRGVRQYLNLDYSYDPANYHPLGIKLFRDRVCPPETPLHTLLPGTPRPRRYATSPASPADATPADPPRTDVTSPSSDMQPATASTEAATAEKRRTLYRLRDADDHNPYTWHFDLCGITLGNFKYRKMSLVRDYATLVDADLRNPAFEATFSLAPRPTAAPEIEALPLAERYDVVPCDSTQAAAIAQAQTGTSYIIQGPPGTGKSQTITNLIVDHVARGKRVLFVCEKRAAIDVVYLRLKQQGLDALCCLIHDSQADKKSFVMDLKRTYEALLEGGAAAPPSGRDELLNQIGQQLNPLTQFNQWMCSAPASTGIRVRELLSRAIELRDQRPELSARELEMLPDYGSWFENRERVSRFAAAFEELQPDGILAHHPLRMLSTRLSGVDRPLEQTTTRLQAAEDLLDRLDAAITRTGLATEGWGTVEQLRQLLAFCHEIEPLTRFELLALCDASSDASRQLAAGQRELERLSSAHRESQEATQGWKKKLTPEETRIALEQARLLEVGAFPFLRPGWWRLRGVLRGAYDFTRHRIRPTWSHILSGLDREHQAADAVARGAQALGNTLGFEGDAAALIERVTRLRSSLVTLAPPARELYDRLRVERQQRRMTDMVLQIEPVLEALDQQLAAILDAHEDRSLEVLRADLGSIRQALPDVPDFLRCLSELAGLPKPLAGALRTLSLDTTRLEAAIAARSVEDLCRADRALGRFTETTRKRHVTRLKTLYRDWRQSNAQEVLRRVRNRFLEHVAISAATNATLVEDQKEFKKAYGRGRRDLEHEFGKSMRYKSIRDLVSGESGEVVKDLKPVWLMSPLSVSDTLPLDQDHFDLVIFDEASQITLEEAVPSLFRARQTIVVGDEMQLPPTDFFSARRSEHEDRLLLDEEGEATSYDLSTSSFLNHAALNLPSRMLGWHYRSRSESLISFSNWAFYQGRLLTVPEEELPAPDRGELRVSSADEGRQNVRELLARAVSFHYLPYGVYDKRRNRAEAEYIAHLVHGLLDDPARPSIGIVAFSEAQQDEIEDALRKLARDDEAFRDRLEAEYEREDDGQFAGLLVKNLENIQGDERDVIILSVCYGPGPDGKMLMNFGPINKSGGEKRLNVAFSRAKRQMALVSSAKHTDIRNEYNDGANCLKNYLRYAAAVSSGDLAGVERVLTELAIRRDVEQPADADADVVSQQIADALRGRGFIVEPQVGQSHFRCDLAIRRPDERRYRLAVLIDTPAYYAQTDLIERDLMRPQLLEDFGWKVERVLAKDWLQDAPAVLQRLTKSL